MGIRNPLEPRGKLARTWEGIQSRASFETDKRFHLATSTRDPPLLVHMAGRSHSKGREELPAPGDAVGGQGAEVGEGVCSLYTIELGFEGQHQACLAFNVRSNEAGTLEGLHATYQLRCDRENRCERPARPPHL